MRVAVRLALGMLPLVSFAVSICSFWKPSNLNRGSRQAQRSWNPQDLPSEVELGDTRFRWRSRYPLTTKIRLMSAFGPKRTFHHVAFDAALGGKADMSLVRYTCVLLTQNGHAHLSARN